MTPDEIPLYAWTGESGLSGPVRGVVLALHGLGGGGESDRCLSAEEQEWARQGALVVYPYYGPWAWMNAQARAMIDDLVDTVYIKYDLDDSRPLIVTGGSMGGQGGLLYTARARRTVRACLVNCPVCDMTYHYTERPDVARTMRCAFGASAGPFEQQLIAHSPLHNVHALPVIPYRIIHGQQDRAVAKKQHSDPMVGAMRARGLQVEYVEVDGMGHCWPLPLAVMVDNVGFVVSALGSL